MYLNKLVSQSLLVKHLNTLSVCRQIINKSSTSIDAKPVEGTNKNVRSFYEIPGPKAYPVIGSLLSVKGLGGDLDFENFDEFTEMLRIRYGDLVRFESPAYKQVFMFNPEQIKQVFRIDGDYPNRPEPLPWKVFLESKGLSMGLILSQSSQWRKMRSASNPIVVRPKTVSLFLPEHNNVVEDVVNIVRSKFSANSSSVTINSFDDMLRLAALELISVVAFDDRLECVNDKKRTPDIDLFVKNVDDLFTYSSQLLFSIPVWKYYRTEKWEKFEKSAEYIFNASRQKVIEKYEELKLKSDEYKADIASKSVLQQYLLVKDKYNLSFDEIVALTADFLIAGVDTTSTVIHFIMYELGRNQEVQNLLYDEISKNFKIGEEVTDDKLERMPYLKAIVKESLRLHPPTPGNGRQLSEDLVVDNYLLPKGTLASMVTPYITRSEKYFKNPMVYEPKRWIKNEPEFDTSRHAYAFLPFGFGTRMCIGRRIAEQEIYTFLIKIIQNFQIEYVGEKTGYRVRIVRQSDKPLDIKFTKRV